MAGRNQYDIPRFLQRAFAIQPRRKDTWYLGRLAQCVRERNPDIPYFLHYNPNVGKMCAANISLNHKLKRRHTTDFYVFAI